MTPKALTQKALGNKLDNNNNNNNNNNYGGINRSASISDRTDQWGIGGTPLLTKNLIVQTRLKS